MFVKKFAVRTRRDFFTGEVLNYYKMKKEIEGTEDNLIHSYVLEYKSRMVDAIDKTFLEISWADNGIRKTKFLKDFFWSKQHRTLYGFCALHCIHENTGRLWIREFLDDVARNFGLDFETE